MVLMTEEEYLKLKTRLIEDLWAFIGRKILSFWLLMFEWSLKLLGAAWPFIMAWLQKNKYLDF